MSEIKRTAKVAFRKATSLTPVSVRRFMTSQKIKQMTLHLMTEEDEKECCSSEARKELILQKYVTKFPKQNALLERKIQKQIRNNPRLSHLDADSLQSIRKQMAYAWFAYGFYPDEFMFFDLSGENKELSRLRSFVSETERWSLRFAMNDFTEYLFADKAETYKRFQKYYKRDAVIINSSRDYDQYSKFVDSHPVFVQKLVSASRGDGVKLIRDLPGGKESYFHSIRKQGKVLLEECIQQDTLFARFNESSVNTLRISTYNTKSGIVAGHGFVRSGRKGSFIDNAAKGGIFASVDVEKGIIESDAFNEFGERFSVHPDSGMAFKGFQIPDYEEVLRICQEIASVMPSMKYISFDLAYSDKGWVIVEINPSGQYIHQAGAPLGFRKKLISIIDQMDLFVPYHLRDY